MNEKKGFSINGYGIFVVLLIAAAFILRQAAVGNIELLT
ncbi:MAG: SPFH domain-containing protein, partial [Alteromonadales bacterium]|nr:SPFH domain-containing protein [Alteromonadales bacterium]